jgi:hypothetical protein
VQLAANVIDLLLLGRVDIFGAAAKIGAGIDHAAIEPEPIEIVGYVVMMRDGRGVVAFRMAEGDPLQGLHEWRQPRQPAHPFGQADAGAEDILDGAVDREIAGDIGIGQPRDAPADEGADNGGGADRQGHPRPGGEVENVAVPKYQAQG